MPIFNFWWLCVCFVSCGVMWAVVSVDWWPFHPARFVYCYTIVPVIFAFRSKVNNHDDDGGNDEKCVYA